MEGWLATLFIPRPSYYNGFMDEVMEGLSPLRCFTGMFRTTNACGLLFSSQGDNWERYQCIWYLFLDNAVSCDRV